MNLNMPKSNQNLNKKEIIKPVHQKVENVKKIDSKNDNDEWESF